MKKDKLYEIYTTASRLFISPGYARTKISHISRETGISVGAIYSIFESKEAILYFVLKCTVDPEFREQEFELPIKQKEFNELSEEMISALDEISAQFEVNLYKVTYSFEDMISDAFDTISHYAVGCLFIENNQNVIPQLTTYYQKFRRRFINTIQKYVKYFIDYGTVRKLEHFEYIILLMVETICTWAMDIHYKTFDHIEVDIKVAKQICLDNIVRAYSLKPSN